MGRAATLAGRIRWCFDALSWYSATLMGDNHYRRYVEHCRRTHPDAPIPSEREYWRMRHATTETNPESRCC